MTLIDVENYAKQLNIKHFRGVFMRDALPDTSLFNECGVINLDSVNNSGTHWTCYNKKGNKAIYFDSFGAQPPKELVKYLNVKHLQYTTDEIQNYDDPPICGHLCLEVLRRFSVGENWNKIRNNIKYNKYVFTKWFQI